MLKLTEFLQALTPDEGKLIVARMCEGDKNGKAFKYFKHVVCDSHAQMQQAVAAIAKSNADCYYALASFKQGFHENTKGKKVVRVRDNVHKIKALWFDIDFKSGLSNPTEVVAALREFCKATRMPAPSILVHSGNGTHVYWPLSYPITEARWQILATSLKNAASNYGLAADHAVTADSCRVLRPIGTRNWKDPNNPKPVVPLFSSGRVFDPDELEVTLLGSRPSLSISGELPAHLQSLGGGSLEEISGSHRQFSNVESFIPNIAKKCGVISHYLATSGEDCSEPEWTAALQLAKHCADGEIYYHGLSEGHPDYTPEETNEKWQQRLENDAGPTVCDTFAGYRPEICGACPHRHKIKTPITLGEDEVVASDGKEFPLRTWRPADGNMGMERKMFEPTTKEYFWKKVLNRAWELQAASSDMMSGAYTLTIMSRLGKAKPVTIDISGRLLGDTHQLKKELGENGVPIKQDEVTHWIALMTTWLEQIQQARNVGNAVSRLGWIEEKEEGTGIINVTGFTAGDTSFFASGEPDHSLRISQEYREIARHYIPRGDIEVWTEAANFLVDQNNPAFTTILSSAFAGPVFGFTGMPGAMLTIVSSMSGVGKSSAMKVAQAVWGSPTRAMNSTSDTYLSIIRKVAFLKNLPVYWDEIRGENALEAFYKTAFDIAQGKERSRLNTNAEMREINDWKTIVIGASNESIFDYMGTAGGQSDAATARTFEIEVDPFDDPMRASRNAMFAMLDSNYGAVGQIYSSYIARNQSKIQNAVRQTYETIYKEWGFHEGERFWAAMVASLLVGAACANDAGLCKIDIKTMKGFLRDRVAVLREKTGQVMAGSSAREVVIAYLQAHQDNQLTIDQFPAPGVKGEPVIHGVPKNKLMIVRAEHTYRMMKHDFTKWLKTSMHMTFTSMEPDMQKNLHLSHMNTVLGAKTKWQLPKGRVIEVVLGE